MIAAATLGQVKALPILEIIQHYIHVKRVGSNFVGLCPFHLEKTPSFSVTPRKGVFKCFGCGAFGDGIEFIKQIENKSFAEAVTTLAGLFNIPVENEGSKQSVNRSYAAGPKIPQSIKSIPFEVFKSSLKGYDRNNFVLALQDLFGPAIAQKLVEQFYIGTSDYWPGAAVFWLLQLDSNRKQLDIKGGQVILYNRETVKTVKEPLPDGSKKRYNSWVHIALKAWFEKRNSPYPRWLGEYIENNEKFPCLFGLQQLYKNPVNKPVAIVEAAKTAIIASVYLPQFIWLACGSLAYLTAPRLKAVAGRNITLFPDLNGYSKWQTKARELAPVLGGKIIVSNLLERTATDRDKQKGFDLTDYLLRRDPQTGWALADRNYPLFWDNPLTLPEGKAKETFFKSEIIKSVNGSGTCNVYELAQYTCIDPEKILQICQQLNKEYGWSLVD